MDFDPRRFDEWEDAGLARQTGYPSVDKPWLKYYRENAKKEANEIPERKLL